MPFHDISLADIDTGGTTTANRLTVGELIELPDGRQARVKALPGKQQIDNPRARVVVELQDPSLQPFQRTIRLDPGTAVIRLGTGRLSTISRTGVETDTRLIPFDRFFGAGGGDAAGRTQFASERALDIARVRDIDAAIALAQQQFDQSERELGISQQQFNQNLDISQQRLDIEHAQLAATLQATRQRLVEIRIQERAANERQRRQLQAEAQMLQQRLANDIRMLNAQLESAAQLQTQRLEFDAKMQAQRLENDRRLAVFGEIGAERRVLLQQQGEARRQQVELAGQDPFRFAFNVRGMQAAGPTPIDIFKGRLSEFATAPLPQVSINAPLAELEGALLGTQQQSLGAPVAPLGLAKGGVIEMGKNTDGSFSLSPNKEISFLKDDGGGIIPGITEVLTIKTGPKHIEQVKVTPLGGGFVHGGTVTAASFPAGTVVNRGGTLYLVTKDLSHKVPRLVKIRNQAALRNSTVDGVALIDLPVKTISATAFKRFDSSSAAPIRSSAPRTLFVGTGGTRLTAKASLAQFPPIEPFKFPEFNLPPIVFPPSPPINIPPVAEVPELPDPPPPPALFPPEELEALGNIAQLPFLEGLRRSVGLGPGPATATIPPGVSGLELSALGAQLPATRAALGILPIGANPPPITGAPLPAFQALAEPLTLLRALTELGVDPAQAQGVSSQFGALPAPFKAASFLGPNLMNLQPQERTGLQSLFGLLGFTPEDINQQIASATPFGRFQNPPRLGFVGRQL